jgi:diguanylate cyclase (GGDEF)-like protein/PAS domain S-box-containing protein
MMRIFSAEAAFDPLLRPYRERADRIMVGMNVFLLLVCSALAPLRDTYAAVLLIGVPTLLLSIWLARQHVGELTTRVFMGCGFMAYTGLIIHQTGGDIEGHFSAFGLIGVLLYYRDWRTIIAATVFIYLHHLILGYAQTLGVPIYVFDTADFWRKFVIHVAYFLPFIGMMAYLSIWLRREGFESANVIALAQRVVQGNLVEDSLSDEEKRMPLISAVLLMKQRLLDLLRVMPVAAAVIRIDTQTIVSVNEAWERTIGTLSDSSTRIGEAPIWADRDTWADLITRLREASDKLLDKVEVNLKRSNGTTFICELSMILHDDVHPVMAILTIEDVTQRRQAEQTMHRLAYRDMLTDLPNRTSLQAELELAWQAWQQQGTPFAVIMMDLDGFKPINDTYGHDAGDEVLKVVGARIMQINRKADLAARLGGDEFVIVLRECPSENSVSLIAQRFIEAIARPIRLNAAGVVVNVGASAGVAHISAGADSIEAAMKNADTALYEAKTTGKNRVAKFNTASAPL